METDNLLSDKMKVGRPEFFKFLRIIQITGSRYIICQGIEPHVNNVFRIPRHFDPPIKGCTRYTEIFKTALNESNHFITARFGLNKIRIFFNESEPSVGVFIKAEEVAFFFYQFQRATAVGANMFTVRQLIFRPERFIRRAIPAFILGFINIAVIKGTLHQSLNNLFMTRLSRSNEIIVGNVEPFPQFFEKCNNFIDIFDRLHTFGFGSTLNFLAVFIRTG